MPTSTAQTRPKLAAAPISFRDACAWIETHHRHHRPPQGHKFSIGAKLNGDLIGVAVVGRPVARGLDDGLCAEVTRLCTIGTANACSFLYGACARAAQAMGYRHIVTYILASESGASLRAVGWGVETDSGGGTWNRPNRSREDKHPTEPKRRYGRRL